MSIGKWIVVAFFLFAAFIGTLVTICVRQDISLVSKDYYKEELAYQDQITRISNTRKLKEKPEIRLINGTLEVDLKSEGQITSGTVKLFNPANARLDQVFELVPSAENRYSFVINDLHRGNYRCKILWAANGQEFYYEEVIFI